MRQIFNYFLRGLWVKPAMTKTTSRARNDRTISESGVVIKGVVSKERK